MTSSERKNMNQTLDVLSPFDGMLVDTIPMHNAADAEEMLDKAVSLFQNRDGWLEHHERISILEKLSDLLKGQAEEFAILIAKEGGKPLTDARIEVSRAIDGIKLAVKELSHIISGKEIPMGLTAAATGRIAFTTNEPIGVVVAVSAFNHPLNLIIHQVIPAIAVGCPTIIKPALTTPLSCLRLCELLSDAGLPDGWCQPIVCDNDVAEILVTSNKINFFSFIGSAKVGWWLRSKLAPGVRCALEHGGSAPVIVDDTVVIDEIIPALLKGSFYHAGQVCVSIQRIFAPEAIASKLAQKLSDGAKKLIVGDALNENTDVGPLILNREVDRVDEWVKEAVDIGAKLCTGGKRLSDSTYAPTVLYNPPTNAKVSTSEIFGPVVCIYSYEDRLDAIKQANSLDFAFQAAVFSNDLNSVMDTAKRLDATAVMVNDHTAFRVDWMPFAGRRNSGYGTGGIGYTMHDMIQPKMIVIKTEKTC